MERKDDEGSFSVFFKVDTIAVESVSDELSDYAKTVWKEAYRCKGGWLVG